jgi:TadE-like protein
MSGGRIIQLARRLRGERSGQALTEFAIVAPLIVMILLFAIWFYELVHIKLKVQEAARYAAWEATAYPLHDYKEGPSANSKLGSQMTTAVMADTMMRYSDLDSSTTLGLSQRIFAASWTGPFPIIINGQEEVVYGGPIVNFIFGIAGFLFDLLSGLNYSNPNMVATSLIAVGKDHGNARMTRMFGNSKWGFNKQGYVTARVGLIVKNEWFNRGVGSMVLPNMGVFIMEKNAVLADSWRLNNGEDVYGGTLRPGVSKNRAYWMQIDRMYMMNKSARSTLKGWTNFFKSLMRAALGFSTSSSSPSNLNDGDFDQATVVSKRYDDEGSGKAQIRQDNGLKKYDTAPVGLTGDAGEHIKPHGETLKDRGKWFMGCGREMSLGCPSSTLQQENPFGDYVVREPSGGSP